MTRRNLMTHRLGMSVLGLCLAAAGAATPHANAVAAAFDPRNLHLSSDRLSFRASQDGSTPQTSLFTMVNLVNAGPTALNWTIFPNDPWIVVVPRQGSLSAGATTAVAVAVDVTKGRVGPQTGTLTIWDADAVKSLAAVSVFLRICEKICVSVDAGATGQIVSPMLFGSQFDWLNSGGYLWNRPASATCGDPALAYGVPAAGMMELLRPLGLRLLRYPSGISADFFHWSEAVGPVATRTPQINPFDPSNRQCPVVGPDEAVSVASDLGTQLLTVANVGNGTPELAASWLNYDLQQGIHAKYWEVGNEVYLSGFPFGDPNGVPFYLAAAHKFPEQYATTFDAYSRALRAVDQTVKVGAVLSPDTSDWNDTTLSKITEPVDFVSTHLLFPYGACTLFTPDDQMYKTLMAAPALIAYQIEQMKQTLARSAMPQNKNADIAITEHGTFFWCLDFDRNRTLAGALYSAMNFNLFFRDPRIVMAMSSNLTSPLYQSPVTNMIFGPPLASPFYHVFRAYAQTAGGTVMGTTVLGSPTFSSEAWGSFPAQTLPVLDTVAVSGPDEGTLRLFVVNRSLTNDVTAHVAFDAFAGNIGSLSMAVVNGASHTSRNVWWAPNAVSTTTKTLTPAPELDVTFPAHSLVVLAVRGAK